MPSNCRADGTMDSTADGRVDETPRIEDSLLATRKVFVFDKRDTLKSVVSIVDSTCVSLFRLHSNTTSELDFR